MVKVTITMKLDVKLNPIEVSVIINELSEIYGGLNVDLKQEKQPQGYSRIFYWK